MDLFLIYFVREHQAQRPGSKFPAAQHPGTAIFPVHLNLGLFLFGDCGPLQLLLAKTSNSAAKHAFWGAKTEEPGVQGQTGKFVTSHQ